MKNPEQDSKWVCLEDSCKHVWYDEYIFEYINCTKCESKNIEEQE